MAPSTYYDAKTRAPSARAQRDAVLGPSQVALWEDNYCVYGVQAANRRSLVGTVVHGSVVMRSSFATPRPARADAV